MRMMLLLCGMLLVMPPYSVAHGQATHLSAAIDTAGSQRMLTQRMLKAYAAIGIDVDTDKAVLQLGEAVARFERQLQELLVSFASTPAAPLLAEINGVWHVHRAQLTQPVSRTHAPQLMRANEELLRISHRVVLTLEDMSGTSHGRLVNMAGRQRMLGQRLAKFYMLRAWGFDNAELRFEIEQARSEFRGALVRLRNAPENTPAITSALHDAERQWELFEHAMNRSEESLVPLVVLTTSERLLTTMDAIVGMYAKLTQN